MEKKSLKKIKQNVDELALIIDAPVNLLPDYGQKIREAHPYIKVDMFGCMSYIVSERGQDARKETYKIDELLYWIFKEITFHMATDYELKNRVEDKDFRRILFDRQEMLLGQLNETWKNIERTAHQQILESYPFDDLGGLRATYWGQLRQQGYSETEINKLAYEKYPAASDIKEQDACRGGF